MFWVLLATLLPLTTALQWTGSLTNNTVMTVCSASDIHLPWNFTLAPDERIVDIKWIYHAEDGSEQLIALFAAGQITTTPAYTGRVQWTGQGGIVISQAAFAESGNYTIIVSTEDSPSHLVRFSKTVYVQMADPPTAESGELHVLQEPDAVLDNTTGQWRVEVTCGVLTSPGHPAVHVVWTTPDGHTMESSSEHNGTFRLLLPNPLSGGNYTCTLPPLSPATRCLPPLSPLLEGATVTVDEVKASFTLLEARQRETEARQQEIEKHVQSENNRLKTELESVKNVNANLQAELESVKNVNDNLQAELESVKNVNANLQAEMDSVKNSTNDKISVLQNTTESLKARLATATPRVSFHAMLTSTFTGRGTLGPFTLISNEGDAFSGTTGIFTAPRKGTYFFVASAGTASSGQWVYMSLLKDGVQVSRAFTEQYSSYRTMGSVQATLQLTAGQRVWLHSYTTSSYYDSTFTSFTGFLVHAYD